jgi:hypothetical protein
MNWLAQNWIELVGNALAFFDIYLLYRNSVWNWPIGILRTAIEPSPSGLGSAVFFFLGVVLLICHFPKTEVEGDANRVTYSGFV